MATCPSGHQSASDDFCDVCGFAIASPGGGALGSGALGGGALDGGAHGSGVMGGAVTSAGLPGEQCPRCGASRTGKFCETCGYNFAAGGIAPPPATRIEPRPAPPLAPAMSQPPVAPPPSVVSAAPTPLTPQWPSGPQPYSPQSPGPQSPGPQSPGPQSPGPQPATSRPFEPPPSEPPPSESWPFESPPSEPQPVQPQPVQAQPQPARSAQSRPAQPGPLKPAPLAGAAWTAVVTADRAYYDSVQATGTADDIGTITFPVYCPERRFRLLGTEARIGRRSARTGIDPEIDLAGPPTDPGVSRLHAVLIKAADGSWSVIDPGSANGTQVNGSEIPRDQIVPLHDGDRINLGAWTELRIVCEG